MVEERPANYDQSKILGSPSAERNKQPIVEELAQILPKNEPLVVCEFACGAGVHTTFFVHELTKAGCQIARWCPSDPDISSRSSIDARKHAECGQLLAKCIQQASEVLFDANGATASPDFVQTPNEYDLMLCINMIHISDWTATIGLMKVAGISLKPGGKLVTYGPYRVAGQMVESNQNFDASLKSRDPGWGVRNLEDVESQAKENGLRLSQ